MSERMKQLEQELDFYKSFVKSRSTDSLSSFPPSSSSQLPSISPPQSSNQSQSPSQSPSTSRKSRGPVFRNYSYEHNPTTPKENPNNPNENSQDTNFSSPSTSLFTTFSTKRESRAWANRTSNSSLTTTPITSPSTASPFSLNKNRQYLLISLFPHLHLIYYHTHTHTYIFTFYFLLTSSFSSLFSPSKVSSEETVI